MLPECHCRRYSYCGEVVTQIHCYCKRAAIDEQTCLICDRPNPPPKQNAEHWIAEHKNMKPPKTPPLTKRIATWADAVAEWDQQGRPVREQAEVDRILKICQKCSWYNRNRQICKGCGCYVTESEWAIFNKIKMATQNCPRRKW